ncbi:MAG: molybdopterin molybdotransferase MoeA [Polyangiaceae bacterium]
MLRFDEALQRVISLGAPALPAEGVAIEDAIGRVLGEDVTSPGDLPPFDYSAMDGYAVRAQDLDAAGAGDRAVRLRVRGESKTGEVPARLEPGSAMRIFTGAPIPAGADAVVMQENVTREGDTCIFHAKSRPGANVRRRGDDLARGAVALRRGTRLRAAHLSLAAAVDRSEVLVARRPSVAVLATGDELRRPGSDPVDGMIPESNTVALRAMCRAVGAAAREHPFVRDDLAATERALAAAVLEHDVVVSVGGVSVGDHDVVRPALEAVGVTLEFWKVAIKPGKPIAIGRFARPSGRETIVVGLPGNPSSALVTFALFGVPLLRALQGDAHPFPAPLRARVTRPIAHTPGRVHFARGALQPMADGLHVTALTNQASGAVTSIAHADCLVVVPAEVNGLAAGEEVDVLPLAELGG